MLNNVVLSYVMLMGESLKIVFVRGLEASDALHGPWCVRWCGLEN